jgi:hypothetical protein
VPEGICKLQPLDPLIVFVDRRHCQKALAQNTKTTFFNYHFLLVKHCLNMMKHRLLVEKDKGNTFRKNQEKKEPFFW